MNVNLNIMNVTIIRIECNITSGAYNNDKPAHTIHEFAVNVPPRYKLFDTLTYVIYLPVVARNDDKKYAHERKMLVLNESHDCKNTSTTIIPQMSQLSLLTERYSIFDDRIVKIETHTYNPYANITFGYSDEIRIPIQSRGKIFNEKTRWKHIRRTAPKLSNNCVAFMFDEIRYELDDVEIDDDISACVSGRGICTNFLCFKAQRSIRGLLKQHRNWKNRYIIFALSQFDVCNLTNMKLFLNSDFYPYDDMNLDFEHKKYAILYYMYVKVRKMYYGYNNRDAILSIREFLVYGSFVVIDCSRQNESIKSATVDIRIEFECKENIPLNMMWSPGHSVLLANTGRKKWAKTYLTWNFHLADAHTLKTTAFAFSLWAANSSLLFQRKTLNPDILISYRSGTHTYADRKRNEEICSSSFDGPGGVLAHAFYSSNVANYITEIKNPKLTTTTQPPTSTITAITTNKPEYVDLCLQYVDTVMVLRHRIFVTYQRYYTYFLDMPGIQIYDIKYDGPHILNSYMNFLPDNFSLSAAYQRPSGELVLFVNNIVYMVEYPSFKLKEGWPKLSSLGFPPNALIDTVVNTNREQTYAIFNNNDVAQIDECSMSVRSYQSLQAVFPGIPSAPTLIFRYMNDNLHFAKKQQFYKFNEFTRIVTEAVGIFFFASLFHFVPFTVRIIRGIRAPSPMYVGNLTLRFGRINNLPILRLGTSTARLPMSKRTVLNIFNLEYCVNRLISSLTAMIDNVDKKFSRLLAIASTVTKSANMLKNDV
ncbi:D2MP protein, partial [Pseudoatta argentina]